MNRTPSNLVYLAIYNPSLHSTGSPSDDDEDAEEQAHILFYTSKERAVSRDRMLRQIGLARALVSFAGMFNAQSPLDTVHSQTRRMIMISPEPNFWIHACVELAKAPRVVQDKGKGKSKDKGKNKGKEKEKVKQGDVPVYDYEDGSVHDGALREDLMRGYEKFKLTHGTFTTILGDIGQEVLALQLERFWTPWAWSWSLENGHDFAQQLGVELHPYFKALLPIINGLQNDVPTNELTALLLTPSNIVPPTNFLERDYPNSLPLFLMSLIPPPPDPSVHEEGPLSSSQATIKGIEKLKDNQDTADKQSGNNGGGILNMQAMDVRKWNWGDVLTFGLRSSGTSPAGSTARSSHSSPRTSMDQQENGSTGNECSGDTTEKVAGKVVEVEGEGSEDSDKHSILDTKVDQNALDDAISSNAVVEDGLPGVHKAPSTSSNESGEGEDEDEEKKTIRELGVVTPRPPPAFLKRTVCLEVNDNPLSTKQRKVYFLLKGQWMLALIASQSEDGGNELQKHLDHVGDKSEKFFEAVEGVVQEELQKPIADSIPSASKILQPSDAHIVSTGKYTFGSKNFQSRSGPLHEAKALQECDPGISEVFSRGQNPQHWHMARRAPVTGGTGGSGGGGEPAEVYMEVFRKETSLADVDNVMTGIVKSWKGISEDVDGL